jgi:hypothetical protein
MKKENNGLLLTVHGAMEFTWRYAWAGFITGSLLGGPFPLLEALGAFAFAAVVTVLSRGRGWRIIHIIGLQGMSLTLAAGAIVHAFYYPTFPFWSQEWLGVFFACRRESLEWIMLFLFFLVVLTFWAGGVNLIRKPPHYYRVCNRFDFGLVAFIVLYLIEWLFLARGGIQAPDPLASLLIFPYFCFSIFAIGLARNRDDEQREYIAGYGGVGMISTVLAILALIIIALFLLFLPTITAVAEMGYAVLREAAEPLGPVLVSVLRFLLLGRRFPHKASSLTDDAGSQPNTMITTESIWWEDILQELVTWGFMGVLGGALLLLTFLGVWVLLRWLLVRTALVEKNEGHGSRILLWIERIRAFLHYCRERILGRGRSGRPITRLYAGLLVWGKRSGVSRLQSETPGEYGARLTRQFPALQKEIELIIELYHGEVYGERQITEGQWTSARSVWRQLRSPLNWPSRLRSWFFRPGIGLSNP